VLKDRQNLGSAAVVLIGLGILYWDVAVNLVRDWATDDNYSHGFLIVPIALYLAWERRRRFDAAEVRPSAIGLALVLGSILVLTLGVIGSERFLTRVSLVGTVAGATAFLFGWQRLKVMAFPILFLLLMMPLPTIVLNQIAFPLQLLASRAGEAALASFSIPVLREGNILVLANTSLEVAEACSGIRSLVSLLTLGIMLGYFSDPRPWVRTAIALSTIPVAIGANAARVAGIGMAAHWYGPSAAEGAFHTISGWMVFVVAMLLMLAFQRVLTRVAPPIAAARLRAAA
jgi:exosortase